MNLKTMYYIASILLFISCMNQPQELIDEQPQVLMNEQGTDSVRIKKEVVVSEFKDTKNIEKNIQNLWVEFDIGFDEKQDFKIFLNDSLIKEFSCRTDYSTGKCLVSENPYKESGFLIPHSLLLHSNHLRVVINKEYIEIDFPDNVKEFNKLSIGRNEKWEASFVNSSEVSKLE